MKQVLLPRRWEMEVDDVGMKQAEEWSAEMSEGEG